MMAPLPPAARSEVAQYLCVAAIQGRFMLQRCRECEAIQFPAADICRVCVGPNLDWRDVDRKGILLAITEIHRSAEPYFQRRTPWRIGLVRIDGGATLIAHLAIGCPTEGEVHLSQLLDAAGAAVLVASAAGTEPAPRGFSMVREGICLLATPNPEAAADTILHALLTVGLDAIQVRRDEVIAIHAREGDRVLQVALRHDGKLE